MTDLLRLSCEVYMILAVYVFWLILSGKITSEIIITGVFLAAAVYVFACFFVSWTWKKECAVYKMIPLAIFYFGVLAIEIFKANIAVIPYIFGKKKPAGVVVHFESPLKSDMANVILANSITLTPGTITLDQHGRTFAVHCLNEELSHGMDSSVFVMLLSKMEAVIEKAKNKTKKERKTKA